MADTQDAVAVKTEALDTVRVYVDIERSIEQKAKMRALQIELETGKRTTRKEYLERLILDDCAKVKGAALREIKSRKS